MDKEYILQVAETAKNQLLTITPMNVVLSWGVKKFIATVFKEMPALKFRVNGRLFKGDVVVALNGSDYYEIYLVNDQEAKCITDRAFYDEVGEIIDRAIERGTNKAEYEQFCQQQWYKLLMG
ncbi:hypothetical protein LDZ77_07635 [Bacteroides xylanisolvens]|jgi:hypothetical protein|uniref:Uncharacterized protein n=1 Tax=Bacteroides xylanisolvens TaxID=371601 RepID=A0A7J5PVB8_9BACE|nr:hypothetical protein [Bacteroides xylanisolvens]KAB6146930.1 hypothetical protein GA398_14440 [Bacteroides xylanisolvens]MCA4532284.1 hypothetical protein [Bacteroides xylanisolvens]MCA4550464.1 hypothetical protein [Bacteroides xylanisolvens]MCA4563909.1 hypothetical protein [Bacteroides xylanisolvens]MCA4568536.1 hypothetical protein [Bacteroides xylanisolvens]